MRARRVRAVLDEGRRFHGDRVVVFLAPGTGELAVVAGRKVGGAVQRNRARRILREAWRQVAPTRGSSHDVVLVARASIGGASTGDLVDEMTELLDR
jgi:ribonuclease P protein component